MPRFLSLLRTVQLQHYPSKAFNLLYKHGLKNNSNSLSNPNILINQCLLENSMQIVMWLKVKFKITTGGFIDRVHALRR